MSVESCLVHGSENASKFQATLTKFRRLQEFSELIYRQVPRHCCSCCGPSNCSSISIDSLRKLCLNLISTMMTKKDSDQENEDLEPLRLKKNKKKQSMKFDRRINLKQQLDDYEDGSDDDDDDDYDGPNMWPKTATQKVNVREEKAKALEIKRQKNQEALLAFFKPIPVPDGCCMVHDRKYQSSFNNLLNQLRNACNYSKRVFYEFPKYCCSCNRERKIDSIDPSLFLKALKEIRSILVVEEEPIENPFDWIILRYKSDLDDRARRLQLGQFIGRDGRNLRNLQDQYNISINIIDESSEENIKERIETIGEVNANEGVVVSFTKRNLTAKYPMKTDEIKEKFLAAWEAIAEKDAEEQKSTRRSGYVRPSRSRIAQLRLRLLKRRNFNRRK